ncbi:MAG: methylenetetrahydrofolate reductase [Treponema sp.]|nr:methylenetetrahydrofolate reductase [Treponema sp.]
MKPSFSFEVFPPRTDAGKETIFTTLDALIDLKPDFVSVTYGAGGSTGNATDVLAGYIRERGVKAVAHLSGMYLTEQDVHKQLDALVAAHVTSVLVLRGDVVPDRVPAGSFSYASDLAAYISAYNGTPFELYGACYPETHPESSSVQQDVQALKAKADAGITHFISQLFFDNDVFYRFLERAHRCGITVPISAGIMPVVNSRRIEHAMKLSGSSVPKKLARIMERYGNFPAAMRDAGIAYAVDQIVDLLAHGVDGIHLYTMNSVSVARSIASAVRSLFSIAG